MNFNANTPFSFPFPNAGKEAQAKLALGKAVAAMAENGQTIGAGAGSSVFVALQCLAERVRGEGLSVRVLCGAFETRLAAARLGLAVVMLPEAAPDWCFDGADEVDPAGDVIKGRGGALFREKLIIASCRKRILLADQSKNVAKLGASFPVPVEVAPEALHIASAGLGALGASEIIVRPAGGKDGPVLTESGNLLLDCRFAAIESGLEREIKGILGVVESGLFQGYGFTRLM